MPTLKVRLLMASSYFDVHYPQSPYHDPHITQTQSNLFHEYKSSIIGQGRPCIILGAKSC
ncbi:Uncharacterized protein APZ42_015108 [Daphnia magna]|uniref:Uncharacterized protein n=1 Tax=Daphnia magna TaxID=35525 RepID=A0A162P6Z1_9CRUS|nr:Uncharacterized protein APZ42_015108 [Daphnia magna]